MQSDGVIFFQRVEWRSFSEWAGEIQGVLSRSFLWCTGEILSMDCRADLFQSGQGRLFQSGLGRWVSEWPGRRVSNDSRVIIFRECRDLWKSLVTKFTIYLKWAAVKPTPPATQQPTKCTFTQPTFPSSPRKKKPVISLNGTHPLNGVSSLESSQDQTVSCD